MALVALADIEPTTVTTTVQVTGNLSPTDKAAMVNQVAEAAKLEPFLSNPGWLAYTNNGQLKTAFEQVLSNRVAVAWNSYRLSAVSSDAVRDILSEGLMREIRLQLMARIQAGVPGSNIVSAIKAAQ